MASDMLQKILDAENKYQTVYLDLQGDIQKTIALDKTQKNYLISCILCIRKSHSIMI